MISGGHEPFPPEKPYDPTEVDRILAKIQDEGDWTT
jgi:hypothetical protein